MSSTSRRHRTRSLALIAATAAAGLFLSGCTSSADPGTTSSSAAPSSASPTASDDPLAELAASVTAAEKPPTTIPLTEPLNTKPETGKVIVNVKCDAPSCNEIAIGMKEGAEAVGWTYKELFYKAADPATLTAAMRQALDMKPTAVAVGGIPPEAGWGQLIPEYKAAGVIIVANYLAKFPIEDPIIANIGGWDYYETVARLSAHWFIVNSGGKGVAILQRIDDFPILKTWSDAWAAEVAAKCPDCKVIDLKSAIGDVFAGKVNSTIVSALQRNPDATYVATCDAEFMEGIDAALKAAGFENVKLTGHNPTVKQQTTILNGADWAMTPQAIQYSGWQHIDVVARHLQDIPFEEADGGFPTQLFVANGDFTPSVSFNMPADFKDQLKKLWLVS